MGQITSKHDLKRIIFLFLLSGWWWVHDDYISETLWKNAFIPVLSFSQSVLVFICVCHHPQNVAVYNTCLLSHGFCGSGMWVWLTVWLWCSSLRLQWPICWGCSPLGAWLGLEGSLVTECPTMWQPASLRDSRVRGEDALGPLSLVSEVTGCQFCHIVFVSSKSPSPAHSCVADSSFWDLCQRIWRRIFKPPHSVFERILTVESLKFFYVNSVRTGKGLVFYPVCKLPSWLATASWMLRKASFWSEHKGSVTQAMPIARCQQFQFPDSQRCDSEGARDIPQDPHSISEGALNAASRRQALMCRVSSSVLSSKDPLEAQPSRAAHPWILSGKIIQNKAVSASSRPWRTIFNIKCFPFRKKNYGKGGYIRQESRNKQMGYVCAHILYITYNLLYIVHYIFYTAYIISCTTYHMYFNL